MNTIPSLFSPSPVAASPGGSGRDPRSVTQVPVSVPGVHKILLR